MAKRKTARTKPLYLGATIGAVIVGAIWLGVSLLSPRHMTAPPKVVIETPIKKPPPEPANRPEETANPPAVPPPPQTTEPAWQRYAVRPTLIPGHPMIAIVLDDMGVDARRSNIALTLPGPLTLSYMTYAKDIVAQAAVAHERGDELMLHIPMEPLGSADPGPKALKTDLSDDEIRSRLDWDLSRLDGIVGVNNHMGSKFTESTRGMSLVVEALQAHGLFLLDSRTTAKTVGASIARQRGLPYAERQVFLDDDQGAPAIAAMLAKTEAIARRQGAVIAIGHPHDATIAALRAWLPHALEQGFQLVPVSTVVARNTGDSSHAIQVSN